ncbi:hypothetical protein LY28_00004 [Ruminiclostridium sufflavum DSM 19573]|uniref:Uncharacterized protein n=1 Tax=Ruminiclostridium sufflavum DSM 19573 TaxID=1121337 RepID=A0A318XRL5_9FIRM|nr:hypothetical protein [Ruminiclostridium sufflavum]PYG90124.1 hypothetical protein LY28_00004 [Ruminiclostridium sufflavum DSM 19573]
MERVCGKELLEQDFPRKIRTEFVRTIKQSYKIVKVLEGDWDYLGSVLGKNIITSFSNVVVECEFMRKIDEGELPFTYKILSNKASTHFHTEFLSKNFIFTISQIDKNGKLPRKAEFRINNSFNNQLPLLVEKESFSEQYYAILTHGKYIKGLSFSNLGIPDEKNGRWLDNCLMRLMSEPFVMTEPEADVVPEEEITEERIVSAKEYLRKRMLGDAK